MAVFLVDNDKTYTYEDLFCSLNHAIEYCPLLKTRDVYVYFVNLIRALTANRPLVLLDSDLNPSEIDGVDENEVNQTKVIEQKSFASMDDVVASLQQSSSEITIFTSGTTGQPKKVVHTVDTLTRSVRLGDKYKGQVWAYAYNPTHMAGLQVFFQAFENQNTLINVFNKQRADVYELIGLHSIVCSSLSSMHTRA